jgi:hypothetical protein
MVPTDCGCSAIPGERSVTRAAVPGARAPHDHSFEFPFMFFSLRNGAQTFQQFMDDTSRELDFCFVYLDDNLVFCQSLEEHEQHLRTLFNRLEKCGILTNGELLMPITHRMEPVHLITQPHQHMARLRPVPATQPHTGSDFHSHYGLLVDCKYKRLLHGVTSLSAPAAHVD